MSGASQRTVRRRSRAGTTAAVVVALVGAALASCSVRPQDHPDVVAVGPLASMQPRASGTGAEPSSHATVYFVRDGRLVAVDRQLPTGDPVGGSLDALVAGPGQQDPEGLQTALPVGTAAWGVTVTDGVATIAVPQDFDRLGARNEVMAVGQLVFTVTARPDVRGVLLTSNGAPIEVPVDGGQLVTRPVKRVDYPSIAPR